MKTCEGCFFRQIDSIGEPCCSILDRFIDDNPERCEAGMLLAACHRQRDRARRAEKSMQHWGEKYVEAQERILYLERRVEQLESGLYTNRQEGK